jgi:hypothetical protein
MSGQKVDVLLNNEYLDTVTVGAEYETLALGHGDTFLLRLAVAGDYDKNGVVDTEDYLVWKGAYGSTLAQADGNGDGIVDAGDFIVWRNNLAPSTPSALELAVSAVPEPTGISAAAVIVVSLLATKLRNRLVGKPVAKM